MTDRAHAAIRHDIITCKLPPGLEVSEQEFAHRLEISKTPVREALARLALEGLVETYPRRGYRITPVAVRDINDLFTVRGALEGVATELAAQNMDDAEIDALEALAEANYTPGEATSVEAFVAANLEFHSAIARGSGVTRLANMVIAHLEEATRLFYMGVNVRDVNPETSQDHRQIIALMKHRAGEEARREQFEVGLGHGTPEVAEHRHYATDRERRPPPRYVRDLAGGESEEDPRDTVHGHRRANRRLRDVEGLRVQRQHRNHGTEAELIDGDQHAHPGQDAPFDRRRVVSRYDDPMNNKNHVP